MDDLSDCVLWAQPPCQYTTVYAGKLRYRNLKKLHNRYSDYYIPHAQAKQM